MRCLPVSNGMPAGTRSYYRNVTWCNTVQRFHVSSNSLRSASKQTARETHLRLPSWPQLYARSQNCAGAAAPECGRPTASMIALGTGFCLAKTCAVTNANA